MCSSLQRIALLTGVLVIFAPSAKAGQLFPPSNHSACTGQNTYLAWNEAGNGLSEAPGSTVDCVSLNTAACSTGEVMTSINGGAPVCALQANPNSGCAAGQVMAGLAAGLPVCVVQTNPDSSCPAGQIMTGISNGLPVCTPLNPPVNATCPLGQVLVSITGGSDTCANPLAGLSQNCPSGQVMVSINGSTVICATPSANISTTTCLAGQVMRGFTNGVPVCVSLSGYPINHPTIGNPSSGNGCIAYTDSSGTPYLSNGNLRSGPDGWSGQSWQRGSVITAVMGFQYVCAISSAGLTQTSHAGLGYAGGTIFYPW